MSRVLLLPFLLTLAESASAQIYSQVRSVNAAGWHNFPAAVLTIMPPTYEFVARATHPRGELITIRSTPGGVVLADNVLVSRRGRIGGRNLALDTLTMQLDQLTGLPAELQAVFAAVERLPGGRVGRTTVHGK